MYFDKQKGYKMKTLLLSLAVLFALAGCAGGSGSSNYDYQNDKTGLFEG